jgi:hypothetical protein
MPYLQPLKKAAAQDKMKHSAPPQGKVRKLKTSARDRFKGRSR